MKRFVIFLSIATTMLILCSSAKGQNTFPQGFNYQAIARNATGSAIINAEMKIKIGILSDTIMNTLVWEEEHTVMTNGYGLFTLIVGGPKGIRTGGSAASFNLVDWSASQMYIYIQIKNPATASAYTPMGKARLWSVPYALLSRQSQSDLSSPFLMNVDTVYLNQNMAIGSAKPMGAQLAVVSGNDASPDPLFEVRRKDGQPVFTVYNDAVTINVPVGGKKGSPSRGGFAVGGFDESKGAFVADLFRVTPDSIRMYINNNPTGTKGSPSRGGFAIGGFDNSKATDNLFLNVSAASLVGTVKSTAQMLWYPKKEAFLAGRIQIASPDSVGLNSTSLGYHSIAAGNWSQAFGYRSIAQGLYSTAIGNMAKATMPNSFAFGNNAQATSANSYALGSGAIASGQYSFAFGSVGFNDSGVPTTTSTTASGDYSMALGMGAVASNKGAMALGVQTIASSLASTALGYYSNATNNYSVAIGYKAVASGYASNAIGYSAESIGNYSTSIGYNTTTSAATSYAFGYNAEASATYGLSLGTNTLAAGTYSTAMGYRSQANGTRSISIGSFYSTSVSIPKIDIGTSDPSDEFSFLPARPVTALTNDTRSFSRDNIANGTYSVAVGNGNLAENGGVVFGSNSDALQGGAVALGTAATANERHSIAAGYNTTANGVYSLALGNNISTTSYGEIALGQWNTVYTGTTTSWNENDLLFSIGNGVNSTNRSSALTIFKNGKTILRGKYAVTTFNNKRAIFTYNPLTGQFVIKDYIYGVYSIIQRDDPSIEYYYSGYFADSGSEGTYRGLYADLLNTSELNTTDLFATGAIINGTSADNPSGFDLYVDGTAGGDYSWNNLSDLRLKTNIVTIPSALSKVMKLRGVNFSWKDTESPEKGTRMGFIAQEVEPIVPEVVNKDGDLYSMQYAPMTALLVEAIKEQQAKIDELTKKQKQSEVKIEELTTRIQRLEKIISNLENK